MPSLIFYPQIILPIQIESCFVDMQPFIAKNVCSILTYDKNHIETEDVQPIIKVQKMILQQNCIGHHLGHPLWPKIWVLASLIFENFEYCPLYLDPFYIIISVFLFLYKGLLFFPAPFHIVFGKSGKKRILFSLGKKRFLFFTFAS